MKLHLFVMCTAKFREEVSVIQTTKLRLFCMYVPKIYLVNYETTLVFEICCQIIGRDEGYPNYETTPVLHICTENLDILYT